MQNQRTKILDHLWSESNSDKPVTTEPIKIMETPNIHKTENPKSKFHRLTKLKTALFKIQIIVVTQTNASSADPTHSTTIEEAA
jgi:hypothetical protein